VNRGEEAGERGGKARTADVQWLSIREPLAREIETFDVHKLRSTQRYKCSEACYPLLFFFSMKREEERFKPLRLWHQVDLQSSWMKRYDAVSRYIESRHFFSILNAHKSYKR